MTRNTEVVSKFAPYLVTALVLAVVLYVRLRLLTVPLERDEGEFAYMGQLLLKGIPPFSHAYTMKLPGVSMMYAFFMFLFGQTPVGVHAGLLIVNGTCIFLVYLLGRRLFDPATALYSCAIYAVLSLSSAVYGVFAHATNFVVMFALGGFLLLFRFFENQRLPLLFASGLCFGLAFTMKQHAAFLLFFAVVYFGWRTWSSPSIVKKDFITRGFLFLLGMIIPYALIVLWMVKAESLANFWFWTVQYARQYASTPSLPALMRGGLNLADALKEILKSQWPFWLIAGFGYSMLWIKRTTCTDRFFAVGLLLSSFVAVSPGLFYRGHYFILLLPAVALLAGAGISSAGSILSSYSSWRSVPSISAVLLIAATMYSLYQGKETFFKQNALEVSRAVYGVNPFPEAQQIADYLKANTTSTDQIAVMGSEPEIYFYADRLSATGHIYMYGLMENHPYAGSMQAQMIREIEASKPKYVVVVNVFESWMVQAASVKSVLEWLEQYVRNQYDQVGVVDILDGNTTHYFWADKAKGYAPVSGTYMTVHKRKS